MPLYDYEFLREDGTPTGVVREMFQHIREEPLATIDGQPVRRRVSLESLNVKIGKRSAFTRDRRNPKGTGVFNPRHPMCPYISESLKPDDREGVSVENRHGIKVRVHEDGLISVYQPRGPYDKYPVVPTEYDRAKWCERQGVVHIKE